MATIEGTKEYFQRLSHKNIAPHAVRTFGKTGFKVACIGFGGYRIHHNSIEHAKAVRYALLNGFNLLDTSSNYGDGGSEMLIGNLLQEMFEREELTRDEIVVVSKVGYIQGQNLKLAQQYKEDGTPFPEVVKYMDGCWHCIHPEFLEDQLSRSLERLQLPALDVYLLHNPEYFLSDSKKRNGRSREQTREEYYHRIKQAFVWLEAKVEQGKIKAYGISSNTFPSPSESDEFTSLERVLEIAEEVSSEHYFRVIQFPFNLFETGAAAEKNQLGNSKTLLRLAREQKLATLVNRPLNAMFGNRLVRLANFRGTHPKEITETFHKKLTTLQRLERQYREKFLHKLDVEIPKQTLKKLFALSTQLNNALSYFQDWEHWDHVKQNLIFPQTMNALNLLTKKMADNVEWRAWADNYAEAAVGFLESITQKYENEAEERSIKLSGKLKSLCNDLGTSETLSQQALRVLAAAPGVDCVLLGMRRIPYVEDAFAALNAEPVQDAADIVIELNED